MTDKGPETPVKLFMSNDDELQPGHTAHGASVGAMNITGSLPGLFMARAGTVSSSYNIRYWG